jgi:hypothetical protein
MCERSTLGINQGKQDDYQTVAAAGGMRGCCRALRGSVRVSTIIQIAIGVAIGVLCPPLGIAMLIYYLFFRSK